MKLLTEEIREKLLRNGEINDVRMMLNQEPINFKPVVKLFTPDAQATWLLTEINPDYPDEAFGLCDLGLGYPELGYVQLSELEALRGPMDLPVERDRHFKARKRIWAYFKQARRLGRIVA